MKLYCIRHGLAQDPHPEQPDRERILTKEGYKKTRSVAQGLAALGVQVEAILTSPYLRASQTAVICHEQGLGPMPVIHEALQPGGDWQSWLTWWQAWQAQGGGAVALVGHLPDLSQWAERLLWGQVGDKLVLKKAGVMLLELPEQGNPVAQAQLLWLLPPRVLAD
ncbi:Phosphohistidine Phosphatase, SixA [Gloeomargarita lithophora Alchichica-D10]|uniref:Phosphohistidine Phosphatase, SixA n=1 Tax=Gloeomargarita lithophora Alchichica-D10 TaxID=1188229 RepID=A0A1J0AET7_9CYAN|nr:phosphohistidine phosphatase SixA [Gloeomargarita lithophora]APB34431.1 Phosphohistidine Phosphatase, SixA [Gloeomargarita lithophora Alchichica-D10]